MKNIQPPRSSDRWWDWTAILLLLVLLSIAYSRLIATRWTEDLEVTRVITNLGLLAGLLLGLSRFRPRWVVLFGLCYGAFVVPWRVGELIGGSVDWRERLISLYGRLEAIIRNLLEQRPVPDNLLFIVLMGILMWALSIHAGYNLVRHGSQWSITLPAGLVIVLFHSYDALSARIWYLMIYLFFSLLTIARVVYVKNRRRWEHNHTYVPPYLGVDFVRITMIATVILLLFTWSIPALANSMPAAQAAWQRIKQPWNEIRNTLDNAFASLRSSLGIVADYYGPSLALGRGNRLSDSVIFYVATPKESPPGVRYYWRARVYDIYQDGWTTALQTTHLVEPDAFELNLPDLLDNPERNYVIVVRLGVPLSTLMAPYQTIWVSRPLRIEYGPNPDGSIDLGSMRASPPLKAGETYELRASFNEVTVDKMRKAGREYPDWVVRRYLQLPATITQRTYQLANQIAAGLDTPYDIAAAVTNYLRLNIKYSETVPALPADKDLVDWFLFDLKQGFCNYYASAEVILLRALGIPARLAVGYAQGAKIPESDTYLVRQKDAHAWPEVYFPGIGWVEFEPTVSQPALARPLGFAPDDSDDPSGRLRDDLAVPDIQGEPEARDLNEEDPTLQANNSQITLYLIILAGLSVAFVLLLIPFLRRRQLISKIPAFPIALENGIRRLGLQPPAFLAFWAKRAALSPLARAYSEINLALTRLGARPNITDTPAERAAALSDELPPSAPPAQTLLREYQLGIYSPKNSADIQTAMKSGAEIRWLSFKEKVRRIIVREPNRSDRYFRY